MTISNTGPAHPTGALALATSNRTTDRASINPRHVARHWRIYAVYALASTFALSGVAVRSEPSADTHTSVSESQAADWRSYGGSYSEDFYSPLKHIRADNVTQLGLAWSLDLPGERTLEATPLAINGVLYFSGTYGKTFAVDAMTGQQLWVFDAQSGDYRPDIFRFSGSLGGHRGVAYWEGKIYVGVIDGRLFALDAKTGKPLWNVQTLDNPYGRQAISGAPRVFNGKVIIGHNGDPGARGYVTTYDAATGRQLWRFYTVPGDPSKGVEDEAMARALKTWRGQWWQHGGNGSVWNSIVYDAKFNRIYLGTANSAPGTFTPSANDNLFTSSIVGLDADTGKYVWHYQQTPGGKWDYDSAMPMVLADLTIGGDQRPVLIHAPKNGFFYVIDRRDGRLISAEKFGKATWATQIDIKSGRPLEASNLREVWPSYLGAHSWHPMSFNPQARLVYIPTMTMGMRIGDLELARLAPGDGTATLLAWDPVQQKKRWEVHYEDSFWNGGTLTTAGDLVFQGTGRGQFIAYSATTGKKLWSFNAGLGIVAAPLSYAVQGTQYISVLVGYGGAVGMAGKLFDLGWRFNDQPRRLLTFALGKHVRLPPSNPPRYNVRVADAPELVIDSLEAAKGAERYRAAGCFLCHGAKLENTGSFAPDLRESALATNFEAFRSLLHDGTRARVGMPKYSDLSEDDYRALFMYIRQRAREATNTSP